LECPKDFFSISIFYLGIVFLGKLGNRKECLYSRDLSKETKLNPFGAFLEIEPQIQGLCHISEFGTKNKMEEELKVGETYDFQILEMNPTEHRMSLRLQKEGSAIETADNTITPQQSEDIVSTEELQEQKEEQ